jgi:hypothetical protein
VRALPCDQTQFSRLRTEEHQVFTEDAHRLDRVLVELCRGGDRQPIPPVELSSGSSLADAAESFVEFRLKHQDLALSETDVVSSIRLIIGPTS